MIPLPTNTGIPGLDRALDILKRSGISVWADYQNGKYVMVDPSKGRRDGVGTFELINMANELELKRSSATT